MRMETRYKMILPVAIGGLMLAACGGGGSSSGSGTTVSGIATTNKNADEVVTESLQLTATLSGYQSTASSSKPGGNTEPESALYAKLGELMNMLPSRQRGPAKLTSITCASGGSVDVTSPDSTSANPYEVSITYNNCNDGTDTANGTLSLSETTNGDGSYNFSMTMGDGNNSADTSDLRYAANDGSYSMVMSFSVSGTDSADLTSGTVTSNGIMSITNGTTTLSLTTNNAGINWSDTATAFTSTMNGGMSLSATNSTTQADFSVTFSNFTHTLYYADYSYAIDGGITFASTPASCADGSYTFTTLIPISADRTSGKLQINSGTVEYLSDGSVLVTAPDGTNQTYTPSELSAASCRA